MNILYNSLTQSTVEFLHWVTQVMLNYFALNVVLTHSFNFFIITKRICDLHHFCKWKFLYSILQVAVSVGTTQLTLSISIMQMLTSVAIMQVLKFYCNYVGGTFCYTYVGGSFCCNDAGDFSVAIYSYRFLQHLCRWKFLQQICGWQILLKLSKWEPVAIMQVALSAVHYAHDYFYCNCAGDCFCCSYVCDSFK